MKLSRRNMRHICAVAIFILGACSKSKDDHDDGRVKHSDPLGFALSHQPGWKVSFEKGAYVQVLSADSKSRAVVFPFLAPTAMSAETCVAQATSIFAELMPDAKVASSRNIKQRPDEAVARYTFSGGIGQSLCSIEGRSGILFLALAPQDSESKIMPELTAIFRSFRFSEPTKADVTKGVPGQEMKDWIDPQEKAFRIKVPSTYKVEGGMFRSSAVDLRVYVRMTSADDKVLAVVGDNTLPPYATPMLGFPEGSEYNPGYGTTMLVKRFLSGGQFSQEYLTGAADKAGCAGAQATGAELSGLTQQMQQQADQGATAGIRTVISAGEAKLACGSGESERVGYIFSITSLTTQDGQSGTWQARPSGYAAPKSREAEARAVVSTAYQSFQYEPEWFKAQQGTTAAAAQIVTKTSNDIADIYRSSNANTQQAMDRVFRQWSNATLGQTDVVDPATGEAYKVASGKNYYWRRNGTNVIAGTDQYERPDIDFTPMTQF